MTGKTLMPFLRRGALLAGLLSCDSATAGDGSPNAELATEVVATGLDTVWELAWGPDGFVWFTERGGRLSRLTPQTGAHSVVGQVVVSEIGEG
jgi:streptogramin lyase